MLKRRRTFIYLALSLMAASWLSFLLKTLLDGVGPSFLATVVGLTLLTLIPLGFSRWLRGLDLRRNLHRGVLVGAFAFLGLFALSSGFFNDYGLFGGGWLNRALANKLSSSTFLNQSTSLALVGLCWWLGLTLGNLPLISTSLLRYFYICLLALAAPSIFFVTDISQDLPWLFFLFLFAALMALGLGRVEEVSRRSQYRESPFTFYWLVQSGLTAGIILSVVGLAHVLKLGYGFGLIMVIVSPIIAALVYPLAFVGAHVGSYLWTQVVSNVSQAAEATEKPIGVQVTQTYNPSSLENVCVGLVVLVFFLVVLFAIPYGARRWRELVWEQEQEERTALPSLGQKVSDVMEGRLERLGFDLPGLGRLRRRLVARSIRRIYAALVGLAAERGYGRPVARTPNEHVWALKQAFPGCETQVVDITEAYIAVHYGEMPESRQVLRETKAAWQHVRESARRTAPLSGQGVVIKEGTDVKKGVLD